MNRRLRTAVTLTMLLCFTGCVTHPPATGKLPGRDKGKETQDQKNDAARGSVTISTIQLNPIVPSSQGATLDFGSLKDITNIQKSVQAANMGISQLEYQSLQLSLALSLAGHQISSSNSTTSNAGVNGNVDLGALGDLLSGKGSAKDNTGADPGTGSTPSAPANPVDGKVTLGVAHDMSYKDTFNSPTVPSKPPDFASAPDDVKAAFVKLLDSTTKHYSLDPQKETALIAAYRMYMDAIEQFYSPDNLKGVSSLSTDGKCEYRPYRALFSVAVQPGWFPELEQYETVVDIDLDPEYDPDDVKGGPRMLVMNVVPAEAAQTLDELSAGISQLSAAGQASGGYATAAFNGAVNDVISTAQRLEGYRKNTTIFASYPEQDKVQLRIRPSISANKHFADMQPSNYVFAATVLVRDPYFYDKAKRDENAENFMTYDGEGDKPAFLEMNYDAYYQRQLQLREKGILVNRGLYYYSPARFHKCKAPVRIDLMDGEQKEVYAVLKPWPAEKKPDPKPFAIVGDVSGFYDKQGKTLSAYLNYAISVPGGGTVTLSSPGSGAVLPMSIGMPHVDPPKGGKDTNQESLVGVVKITGIPAPAQDGTPVHILLQVTEDSTQKSHVQDIVIGARHAPPAPKYPVITVEKAGVSVSPTNLDKLDAKKLGAILGN